VFDVIVEKASQLVDAYGGGLWLVEGTTRAVGRRARRPHAQAYSDYVAGIRSAPATCWVTSRCGDRTCTSPI
jgi:hypothetical protein